jgi:hypothetical protein
MNLGVSPEAIPCAQLIQPEGRTDQECSGAPLEWNAKGAGQLGDAAKQESMGRFQPGLF